MTSGVHRKDVDIDVSVCDPDDEFACLPDLERAEQWADDTGWEL